MVIDADWTGFTQTILLYSEESEIRVNFKSGSVEKIVFGGKSEIVNQVRNNTGWILGDAVNRIRLYVNKGIVKLYINDVLFNSYELEEPNFNYKKLLINGIKEGDRIFGVKCTNLI